jgi:hypothetical protein
LKAIYANEADAATLQRSIAFGKEVATRVFAWAAIDGSANVNPPYCSLPSFVGPAFWVQSVGPGTTLNTTPPNNPQAANPYASQRRLWFLVSQMALHWKHRRHILQIPHHLFMQW